MTNVFDDVMCQFDVLDHGRVVFYIDLTVYPQFKDSHFTGKSLTDIIDLHPGAERAEYWVKGELLTILVYGRVNHVTVVTNVEQEK